MPSANTIGGTTPAAGNVISGNVSDGVMIVGVSTDNLVQGNYIGTDATGTSSLVTRATASRSAVSIDNTIGGTTPGARNVISGNVGDGVRITDFVDRQPGQGNYIGTDASGTRPLATRATASRSAGRDQQHDRRHHARGPQRHLRQSSSLAC